MRRRSISIIFVLLLAAGLSLPGLAAEEDSSLSTLLGMLEGLSAGAETEASPFMPPGFGGTPPGQGGIPPGQTNPPGQGGIPPGQSGETPAPPSQEGEPQPDPEE